jgi:N-methylhydantoinase A
MRVGVDVGGTFTDCVSVDSTGVVRVSKVSTTSPQSRGMIASMQRLDVDFSEISEVMHGTTVSTNAILQRSGGPAALIVSEGFRDLLELQRGNRSELYRLDYAKARPLVPPQAILEVRERIGSQGDIVKPLDVSSLLPRVGKLFQRGVRSFGICLLFSYLNPRHELELRDVLKNTWRGIHVSLSSEIAPEWKEFERANTTAINAYLVPVVSNYLTEVGELLSRSGFSRDFFVMQSNGGLMTSTVAARFPFRAIGSGPAAGAQAAARVALECGFPNAVTLDMGGTSTDIALVEEGVVARRTETEIEHGLPLKASAVDVHSIGSGAGSIARVDRYGVLTVGPQSAGAMPGPAAYGRGGREATFMDAAVVMGWFDPSLPLGTDEVTIDPDLAARAIEVVAKAAGTNTEEAADGIIRLGIERIASACRSITVSQGRDPRTMGLVAFGGAGPVVASFIARTLGMRGFAVPAHPGVHSAFGLTTSDFMYDFSRTAPVRSSNASGDAIEAIFKSLEDEARALLVAEGLPLVHVRLVRSVDARYRGQTHEVQVQLGERFYLNDCLGAFHNRHQELYSYCLPERHVELVTFRVTALAGRERRVRPGGMSNLKEAPPETTRWIRVGRDLVEARALAREAIGVNQTVSGPAIIHQMDATVLLLPGDEACQDERGNLVVNRR